ncbi:E3 ubiquitin-protein ligase parkin-like [Ptychodera flava]|uniref:E3 ubiquitin-protein ligase parkin-like n=1 Tax=Ptychodera flava TaxID=63121 RepID=UPI00396A6011
MLSLLSAVFARPFRTDNDLHGMSAFTISVRITSHETFLIDVEPTWTIRDLKRAIASRKTDQTLGDDGQYTCGTLHLINSGRELLDHYTIQECNLHQQSVIHVVIRQSSDDVDVARQPEDGRDYTSIVSSISDHKPHFYVYCKTCQGIRTGKLRVCCRLCKLDTLIVQQDPVCWDDVLQPERIHGTCQSSGCHGNHAEFYFKCGSHVTPEREQVVVLYLIKTNTRDVPCITCTDVCDPVLIFPCDSGHSMCLDCFGQYCTTKLNDRQFIETPEHGYTLACPAGCENSLIRETHHFRILDEQQYERYKRFGAEEWVLQSGGVLCPRPGCSEGFDVPDQQLRRIQCEACQFVFCRQCHHEYHEGECGQQPSGSSSHNYNVNPERARWERQSIDTIKQTTKPCPKCKVPVEKNGGCMHMSCPRQQCQFQWCWNCEKEWNRSCQADHWFQ